MAWLLLVGHALGDPKRLLGIGAGLAHTPKDALSHSFVMVVAMMVPLVLPAVRHVALFSLWNRRHRAAAGFLAGYVTVWTVAAAVLLLLGQWLVGVAGRTVPLALAILVAAAWQVTPRRRRLLGACRRTAPLSPSGNRADADCVRFGIQVGRRCVGTCWAVMAVAILSHGAAVMAVVSVVQVMERCPTLGLITARERR